MATKWKIFGVLNIIEGIMIAGTLIYLITYSFSDIANGVNESGSVAAYTIGVGLVLMFLIGVVVNCFNNYFIVRADIRINKKRLFWLLFAAFLLFIIWFIFLVFYFYFGGLELSRVVLFIDLLLIDLLGLYILIFQVLLAINFKRAEKNDIESVVAAIGQE